MRLIGFEADTKSILETWYLSNGWQLRIRFSDITANQMSGTITWVDDAGNTTQGTVSSEKAGDKGTRTTVKGKMPGETEETTRIWVSKRK